MSAPVRTSPDRPVWTSSRAFLRPGQTNGGHKRQIEPGLAKVMGQRSMTIASCLEPDQHGQLVGGKSGGQTPEILQRVRDRQSATAPLTRDANQDLVSVFGVRRQIIRDR